MSFEELEVYNIEVITSSEKNMNETNADQSDLVQPIAEVQDQVELTEEEQAAKEKATKAIMWLSAYMKQVLAPYLDSEGSTYGSEEHMQILQSKIVNRYLFEEISRIKTLLDTFISVVNIGDFKQDKRQAALAAWHQLDADLSSSKQSEMYETYQELEPEDIMDREEFGVLLEEFSHDINTAGLAVLSDQAQQYVDSPFSNRFEHRSEMFQKLADSYDTVNMYKAQTNIQQIADKYVKIDVETLALAVYQVNDVLNAFNMESGSVGYEQAPAGSTVDYVNKFVKNSKEKYSFRMDLRLSVNQEEKSNKTQMNKAVLARFLTNALSNAERIGAVNVMVRLELKDGEMTVYVADDGNGFPSVTNETTRVLDQVIQLYQVERGKTNWKNATGTGTGLAGMVNMMKTINGEFLAGNRIRSEQDTNDPSKVLGGISVIRAKVN